ncbi:MAG: RidA family protein [Chloroflexi bacterium AL-W]|nr:RidA family protein [Chloroflexi bacterium AL-N1]NOK66217.1 RidA family protein [Chloroflexi bacterium AL-N10]NOK73098.1 RidA family protein [Chloroflexi bacterium AL-N5]NOK79995.1 RidA family protein [Chloroflexi bacterium AL-W]NOK88149.1 RidA family protein [Chloroflexi bacterium AL-N15]
MTNTYINPPSLFSSQQYGFSQVVATQGGTTIYLSGQTAWDAQQDIGDPHDLGVQTQRTLHNIELAVQAAGGTRNDVVSIRVYIVGDHIHHNQPVSEALRQFFHAERLPTSTFIGVTALANPDFLIEIEAIAVVNSTNSGEM